MTGFAITQTSTERRQVWLRELRAACIIVSEKSPGLIRSISVTQRFANVSAEERAEMLTLASRLAGEYGLEAETMDRGAAVTVWISRPVLAESKDGVNERNDEGFVARALHLLRSRQHATEGDRPAAEEVLDGTPYAPVGKSIVRS